MKKLIVLVCMLGFTLFADCTFGAPAITSPTSGTKLTDTTVTFSWNPDGYTYFQFYAGDNIAPYQSDTITDTSITLAGLPNDGSPIFVRLTYWDGTEWIKISYFYQSTGSGALLPSITSPKPGIDITTQSQTFQLDFGDYKVDTWSSFQLDLGSVPLGTDIFESGGTADNTFVINNLPQDNSTLYVTLRYWDGIGWENVEYTYLSKAFPWAMFLPAITTPHECGLDDLGFCSDKVSCESVGAYWWDNECHMISIGDRIYVTTDGKMVQYKAGYKIYYEGTMEGPIGSGVQVTKAGTGFTIFSHSPWTTSNLPDAPTPITPPQLRQTTIFTIDGETSSSITDFNQDGDGRLKVIIDPDGYYHNHPDGAVRTESPLYVGKSWSFDYSSKSYRSGTYSDGEGYWYATEHGSYKGDYTVVGTEVVTINDQEKYEAYKIYFTYSDPNGTEEGWMWIYPKLGVIKGDTTVGYRYYYNPLATRIRYYRFKYSMTGSNFKPDNLPYR